MKDLNYQSEIYRTIIDALNLYDELPNTKIKSLSKDRVLNLVASWIQFYQENESEPEVALSDLVWIGHNKIKKLISSDECQFDFESYNKTDHDKNVFLEFLRGQIVCPYLNEEAV